MHGAALDRAATAGTNSKSGDGVLAQPLDVAAVPGVEAIAGQLDPPVAHTGITPCFFHGRSTRLSFAIRSPLMIVGRVSRGSMMSSIRSLRAAR